MTFKAVRHMVIEINPYKTPNHRDNTSQKVHQMRFRSLEPGKELGKREVVKETAYFM